MKSRNRINKYYNTRTVLFNPNFAALCLCFDLTQRRKLKKLNSTAPVQGVVAAEDVHQAETNTVPVQGVAAVEEVHPAETDTNNNHVCPDHGNVDNEFHKDDTPTNNNPVPDLVPSLCEYIDRKKHYKQH